MTSERTGALPPPAAPNDSAPPCPACGGSERRQVSAPPAPWQYLRCSGCGHESLWPVPSSTLLAAHYNTTYAVPRARYERRALARLHQISPWFPNASGGSVLEVGCSYGAVLAGLRDLGWRTEGIELDARAAAVARSQRGLRVHDTELETARPILREAPYGLVVALHVIEHLPDPAAWLTGLRNLMRPGARLVIATPNAASRAARMAGGYWEWRSTPDHVQLFTPASLGLMLGRAGFGLVASDTGRGDAHGLGFEWLRCTAKRRRDRASPECPVRHAADDPERPSTRWWYGAAEGFLNAVSRPIEALLDADDGAELRLVAETAPIGVSFSLQRPDDRPVER